MLRAMDSAVAGLRAHQNKMDVIGHNLANVNTFGYKAQTYSFKEAVYQTSSPSTAGSASAGGTNAAQYGYGTLMGTIGMDMTTSTPTQLSGLNAAIDGDGFFITFATPDQKVASETVINEKTISWDYTRVGQFSLDSEGYLVDGNGKFVYGYINDAVGNIEDADYQNTDPTIAIEKLGAIRMPVKGGTGGADEGVYKADSIEIDKLGRVNVMIGDKVLTLGRLAIVSFQNPNGLTKIGETYYNASSNDNTGVAEVDAPGGSATLIPGYIENSNVDMAKEFAEMITTHRGFQANSKMITVSDEMLSELVSMKR